MNRVENLDNAIMEIEKQSAVSKWAGKGKSFAQMLEAYKNQEEVKFKLDFRKWLPSLANVMSPLKPGQSFGVFANTGGGKTLIIQQMIMKLCAPLRTLFIEMELPDIDTMERFVAMKNMTSTKLSEQIAKEGRADYMVPAFSHLTTYSHMKFSLKDIEEIIDYEQPQVVILDYMGLIRGEGKTRYEKLSDIAEELKLLATTKNVIMITTCQVRRDPSRVGGEVFLHDAKDSGSIENSCQKIIGVWREGSELEIVKIKVLKNQGLRDMILTSKLNNETLNVWED